MFALVFLTALAADTAPTTPAEPRHPTRSRDPIKLTVPEIRHLLAAVLTPPALSAARLLHWSTWRRRHQATARRGHYKRRSADETCWIDHETALEH
ncbi:hypothetical protein M4914_22770 [Streptomyces somaliensis DSM 40738]|uniref:Uncharacterized protein n=1 Tax=Streptomyces somaliensis (strain ATCC 33201 / DSM 40738 / JCM 12659 / KCTC 9044 / NCTC 11332 / NRRL B-12077 / IP 733) TaxID=1134445 RepID=A0AA44DFR8_STRE0|nr:hypothetical protein [Streptomyces somaliensis]MCQ0025478.1 hypothetical protein [Streptomyces somaliensis DSM 40738]NKY15417.1 hypothetical protein [Streptomyces somaliensis DSM 40738]